MRFTQKRVEDCFDHSAIYEYRLETPTTETSIRALGQELGRLQYFPDFPRPFYRILAEDLQIRGVQGERDFQAVFPLSNRPKRKGALEEILKKL